MCKAIKSQENLDKSLSQFTKETHFYTDIVPVFKHFEELENIPQIDRIDAFLQYFGSRLSLNPSKSFNSSNKSLINFWTDEINNLFPIEITGATKADTDAVLLLENLKFANYINGDRRIGLSKEEIVAILKVFAIFHFFSEWVKYF